MQPQDIRLGLSHYQNISNAMDKSVEAQNMMTQSFERLADNAMKFSDFFARRQEAKEQKAFREKAYNDEKAYKEQRDSINDERYTKEFDENKRRYDSDLALKNKLTNAQVNLYGKQATGLHYANQLSKAQNATGILALRQNLQSGGGNDVATKTAENATDSSLLNLGGNNALNQAQKEFNKHGVKKTATMGSKSLPNLTNDNIASRF
ncbi:hypothetical protein [Helicobacter labetoulli]|uniref:hypothetical protein n=1 Tax=Helicobacter labetoulli TaxID=2315333 RepID=UPI000EF6F496|nr:hypothetical protein [Helicobacter labetoulli]